MGVGGFSDLEGIDSDPRRQMIGVSSSRLAGSARSKMY